MAWEPWEFLVSDGLRRRIVGRLWGQQRPPRRPPPNPDEDARSRSHEALRAYILEIVFSKANPPLAPTFYRLPEDRVLIEEPDDSSGNLLFPRVVILPGPAEYLTVGTTPNVYEETWHRYGRDTVLVGTHDYQERLMVEVWATTRFQRRMIVAGLEQMLSVVIEQSPGVRLRLRDYYDQIAIFQLLERMNIDDEDSQRRRRRAHITVELRVPIVRLVNVQELTTLVAVYASDEAGPVPQT